MGGIGGEGFASRAREDLLAKSDRTLYRNLDGVRAIAALLVLAAHSLWGTAAFGATGVWLFFVLSGFLLFPTLPRRHDGHYLLRLAGFFIKRITRLIPLYYIALLVYSAKWHKEVFWLIDHVLFLDAKTFFWTVKMEAIFYLLLPLIGLLSYLIPGRIPKFVALALATVAYLVSCRPDVFRRDALRCRCGRSAAQRHILQSDHPHCGRMRIQLLHMAGARHADSLRRRVLSRSVALSAARVLCHGRGDLFRLNFLLCRF